MKYYPSYLPLPQIDYSYSNYNRTIQTSFESGRISQRSQATKQRDIISVSFQFDFFKLGVFESFIQTTLVNGALEFTIDLPNQITQLVEPTIVLISNGRYKTQSIAGTLFWKVTCDLIKQDKPVFTQAELDVFEALYGEAPPETDADVVAYVAAVEAAKGSSITNIQEDAINAFIVAEKLASRWVSHKRIFLPIWSNAAANAIDMKTLAVGTFSGTGVTHSAGSIKGNSSTGYFADTQSPNTLGLTVSSGGIGWLAPYAATIAGNGMMGSYEAGSAILGQWYSGDGPRFNYGDYGNGFTIGVNETIAFTSGIISMQRQGGQRRLTRRITSGRSTLFSDTSANYGTIPVWPIVLMGYNNSGTPLANSDLPFGAAFINTGFTDADESAFTANLKTLWETCTGLTLP